MKVLVIGHKYELANFENPEKPGQIIQFIQKFQEDETGKMAPAQVTVSDGTTNEELVDVLIDRLEFLNDKFPCRENGEAILGLKRTKDALAQRTANRQARGVEGKHVL